MGLSELRKSVGMSQRDLANATGISVRLLQAYEQGVRDINGAKLLTLLQLANVLNCSIDQIISDNATLDQLSIYQHNLLQGTTNVV